MLVGKIFQNKRRIVANSEGFTLTEMMVSMAIIALLFSLMAFELLNQDKKLKLRHSVKEVQTSIRQAANNAVTVSPDMGNVNIPAKAWTIHFDEDTQTIEIVDYYGDTNPSVTVARSEGSSTRVIKIDENITFELTQPTNSAPKMDLVFSAPFAKFKAVKSGIPQDWDENSETGEISPTGAVLNQDVEIEFTEGSSGDRQKIRINHKTGEASIVE